ncbi:MAG: polysaccharide deacetylase family protein [Chitinophagales bacterium]
MKDFIEKPKQNVLLFILLAGLLISNSGCNTNASVNSVQIAIGKQFAVAAEEAILPQPKTAFILSRPQIPILCYHQIRNWTSSDSKRAEDYIVPVSNFREQMELLAKNGYHTILPDQLYSYLLKGTSLPSSPVMISFDDTRAEQFTVADAEMKKYGFKGVFFIMTVSLGRPGYMTKEEVRQLADEGNIIGSHTWDHSNVKNYLAEDWIKQVDKPSQQLENITGKPVNYFAYPFGLWNQKAIEQLKQRGFKAAFQLSAKRDENDPLFTIRRIIIPGAWGTTTLQKWMDQSF